MLEEDSKLKNETEQLTPDQVGGIKDQVLLTKDEPKEQEKTLKIKNISICICLVFVIVVIGRCIFTFFRG